MQCLARIRLSPELHSCGWKLYIDAISFGGLLELRFPSHLDNDEVDLASHSGVYRDFERLIESRGNSIAERA